MKLRAILPFFLLLLLCLPAGVFSAGSYAVTKKVVEGHTTYHLLDAGRKMDFGVVPDLGDFGYELKVKGKNLFVSPESLKAYREQRWFCCGMPILWPWVGRIDRDHYFFQGKKFFFNNALGNLQLDQAKLPTHGLLSFDPRWEVVKTGASDAEGAFITSRVEFYKYPDLMAQFPFAHTIEVTYRLKDGKLETTTKVSNVGRAPMPFHLGHHPYFRPEGPREQRWCTERSLILLSFTRRPT